VERSGAITVFAFWTQAESYQAMRQNRQDFIRLLAANLIKATRTTGIE
jgi:hypothetical protein